MTAADYSWDPATRDPALRCDHCGKKVQSDPDGRWVAYTLGADYLTTGADVDDVLTSDCDASDRGHEVNGSSTRDPAMVPTERCHPDYHDFRIGFARCLRCPEPNPDFDPDFDPWAEPDPT